jgi:hypothetical protein
MSDHDTTILVKKAFDRGFIDSHVLGFEHFEQDLRRGIKHPGEPWRPDDRDHTLFGDTIDGSITSPTSSWMRVFRSYAQLWCRSPLFASDPFTWCARSFGPFRLRRNYHPQANTEFWCELLAIHHPVLNTKPYREAAWRDIDSRLAEIADRETTLARGRENLRQAIAG